MYTVTMRVRTGTDEETGWPIHEEITEEVLGQDAGDALKAAKAAADRWKVRVDKVVPGPDPDPNRLPGQGVLSVVADENGEVID